MSATEVDVARPVVVLGWQTADRLFGEEIEPLDKVIQIEGVHFRVVGVSAKRGTLRGHVLVSENVSVRHLAFRDNGDVDDLDALAFGSGLDQIPGAIGVTP